METRYTFTKQEKLCSRKQIDQLFSDGRWLRSEHLRMVYLICEKELPFPVQIMFSVPKKFHRRAVKRNLLKRRLREAFRLNKLPIYEALNSNQRKLYIGVVYSSGKVCEYITIEKELKFLLAQLETRIARF